MSNRDKTKRPASAALWPLLPAAAYLSISLRTLKALVAAGEIPVVRVSPRRIAIDPRDLDRFVESRKSIRS